MRRSLVLLIIAAITIGGMTGAGALVPSGVFIYEDHGRAKATEAAVLTVSPGGQLVIESSTLAPSAGWKDYDGPAVFVIATGTLAIRSASGCTTQEYAAGQAAVVPAGRHLLTNAGDEPVAFTAAFLGVAVDRATPFPDGAESDSSTGCVGGLQAATSGASSAGSSRGVFVGPDAYRNSAHAHHAGGIEVEPDTDILVSSYRAQPHASTGWMTHRPALGIVTKGIVTYYEGRDGRCVKSGEFTAGQAYVHASPVTHMAVNEGPDVFEGIYVYFNLRHNARPLPLVGHQTDAIDFTALPPQDCPRVT